MGLSAFSKHFFDDCDTLLAKSRVWAGETRDILRKRTVYRQVRWTVSETQEFNRYWREYFGRRISPRCHKYCQFFTNRFDVRYFPETLVTTKLFFRLNPYSITKHLLGKEWHEILFAGGSESFPGVTVPRTYGVKVGNYCYDGGRNVVSFDRLCRSILDEAPSVILKPLAMSSGRGIEFYDLSVSLDRTRFSQDIEARSSFLIQEQVKTSPALRNLYSGAVSTFRVITYICGSEIFHLPSAMRIGSGGGRVDNIHAGGICVGIDPETETLRSTAYRLGYGENYAAFTSHPDTKIEFQGYKIPGFTEILRAAHRLHGKLPSIGMIAWDWTLNEESLPVLIEINLESPGTAFLQITNDQPLFGSNTEKIIKLIR